MHAQKMHLILLAADPNTTASTQQLNLPFEKTTEARIGFFSQFESISGQERLNCIGKDVLHATRVCGSNTGSTVVATAQGTASG